MLELLQHYDIRLFVFLNSMHHPVLDWIFWIITQLGNVWVVLPVILGTIYLASRRAPSHRIVVCVLLSLVVAGIMIFTIKALVNRQRPFSYFEQHSYEIHQPDFVVGDYLSERVLDKIPSVLSESLNQSFPSGHATIAFACATILVYLYGGVFWSMYGVALLVAYSRVYLGVHFPFDTVAGGVLGVVVVLLVMNVCCGRKR